MRWSRLYSIVGLTLMYKEKYVCVWVGVMEGGGAVLAMKFVGQTFKLEACYMYFTGSFLGLIQFCLLSP